MYFVRRRAFLAVRFVLCAVACKRVTVSEERSDAAADGGSPGHPGFFTIKVQPVYCSYGELQGTFAKFGDIDAVVIKPGTPPYGFITFAAEASAVAASEESDQNIRGVWCRVALNTTTKLQRHRRTWARRGRASASCVPRWGPLAHLPRLIDKPPCHSTTNAHTSTQAHKH